jgi:hypothetical protein
MGGLPRRDLWLLPLIAGLTVFVLLMGAELASRWLWPAQLVDACGMPDAALGYRFRAGCSSVMKAAEGPWYTNSYNECGYRSVASCRPLPPGHRRIALIGSSLSEGYLVAYSDTMAARIEADLTRMCGAPVEVQNLGAGNYAGRRLILRMDEALRLRPDAILDVTNPFDLEESLVGDQAGTVAPPASPGLQRRVFLALKESRALVVAQHFMFRDQSIYLPLYLRYGDKADFLRPPFSAPWQERLRRLDALVGALAQRAQAAGVPFMLAFVPQAAEVELMAEPIVPPGIDPAALPAAIAAIVARHHAWFTDTSAALRARPADQLYYIVDGHLSAEGHGLAAALIAQRLVDEPGSPFADCRPVRSVSTQEGPERQ